MITQEARFKFAGCSSSNAANAYYGTNGFFGSKKRAVYMFNTALQRFDLSLSDDDLPGDTGCKTLRILDDCDKVVGSADLAWRKTDRGYWDVAGCIN